MPGSTAWIATFESRPSGLLLLRQAADEAEIITIGVLPQQRRTGLGGALLHDATGQLQQCKALFLEVSETNAGARQFYLDLGFAEAGRRKDYYADGSDALIMTARLPLSCGGAAPSL